MSRFLIILGLVLIAIGVLNRIVTFSGLGRLPGDLTLEWKNIRIYLPVGSCILLSLLLSLILQLLAWLER